MQARIRVVGRRVRIVAALVAAEIDLGITTAGAVAGRASSLGRKLFMLQHASMSVPSTEKWSLDSRRFTRDNARIDDKKRTATSPSRSRSRFFEKVEASHTRSSMRAS
ncbi:hypothetical protein F9288_00435 [Sphingomonas sp. CL5.1]|nr:hypothetical protein F9288_00435 [Sphingomonas sp. CL5.1]